MGYVLSYGECGKCDEGFSFNPTTVPIIQTERGERLPICRECIERANIILEAIGAEPEYINPNAYSSIDPNTLKKW